MTMTEPTSRNGVDVDALFGTINVVKGQPELAQFTFRASNTWVDGTWRPGATQPTPTAFPADRELDPEYVGELDRYLGLDVPYSGYCPCRPTSNGIHVDAIGRKPATFGTDVHMFGGDGALCGVELILTERST